MVAVVEDSEAKCLLTTRSEATAETCGNLAAIDRGEAVSVSNECGPVGERLMEIIGLVPAGTTTVVLTYDDGSTQQVEAEHGAFKFDGTTPTGSAPYPTGVTWLAPSGATLGSAPLPVEGDEFCLPTS